MTIDSFSRNIAELEDALAKNGHGGDVLVHAEYYRDVIIIAMSKLRCDGNKLETMVDASIWPLPTYTELLFTLQTYDSAAENTKARVRNPNAGFVC